MCGPKTISAEAKKSLTYQKNFLKFLEYRTIVYSILVQLALSLGHIFVPKCGLVTKPIILVYKYDLNYLCHSSSLKDL